MGNFMSLGRRKPELRMRSEPSMTVKAQIPGYGNVAIEVPGTDEDDVRDTFTEWLAGADGESDWRTIDATIDGQRKQITFRASFVAGFNISGR